MDGRLKVIGLSKFPYGGINRSMGTRRVTFNGCVSALDGLMLYVIDRCFAICIYLLYDNNVVTRNAFHAFSAHIVCD